MDSLLFYIVAAVGGTAVVWWGGDMLESSSEKLALYYRLPKIFRGAILAAVGSSFPELSSSVISTLIHGEFDLGVSAIVGSAIFNILVIPAISGLAAGKLKANHTLVYKDAQFYITSVAVLLLAFSFAVIYNPVEGETLSGEVNRAIALVPFLLYGLYIFLQFQDVKDERADQDEPRPKDISPQKSWLRLVLSLVLIVGGVEGLVRAALGFGEYFDTPSFLWGLTIIAAGTSIPDAYVSVKVARRGEGVVSLANVLGSNIFDLLVAVPVGILIAGTAPIDFKAAAPMMGFLTLATIVLFTMMRTKLSLNKAECWSLLVLYIVFVGWMVLETIGITSIVR
ncbi:cation:H+ antiporter [Catalinimonas alkaloidigena]|uniref:sodium:calcium antiporter n=1 Tax=Catalinimonas alkaloidigena TaxID=1075417 RepID=UPI002404C0D7|nr:sodium:calcium antiporter [Catalinimonas alkaloidigena]MDF9800144.1 cation:H+ antiporter [Catalinimonas alkaloidigena]